MISISAPRFGPEEQAAVQAVLQSGHVAAGPKVAEFEQRFAAHAGAGHGAATTNGTTAIQVALEAMGIGPGDEVIVPAFTFIASVNAILYAGAKPVFADIDARRYTLDPDAAATAVTANTKAIMPVHLYGQMADMPRLQELAHDGGVGLLCDAAQAHGAVLDDRRVGSWGDVQTWSFYPTKNMSSIEGGMVTTDNEELVVRARSISNHGRADAGLGQYGHDRRGGNFRLSDVHAAVGLVQLDHLDDWVGRRREIAARYNKAFADLATIIPPYVAPGSGHAYHQYTLRCEDRNAVQAVLEGAGIQTAVYYPHVAYEYPHLRRLRSHCPVSDATSREVLSIPVHPYLEDHEVEQVIGAVRQADERCLASVAG